MPGRIGSQTFDVGASSEPWTPGRPSAGVTGSARQAAEEVEALADVADSRGLVADLALDDERAGVADGLEGP